MAKRPTQHADPGPEHRIVVLAGREVFLHHEHTARLRARLAERHGRVDSVRFDGDDAAPADVLDECRSESLMGGHRMVIVDQADQFLREGNRPVVERYAAAPAASATLVLRAERWNKGKLDALVEAVGLIVACEAASGPEAVAWAMARCSKRHAATLAPDAARALVDLVGADLGRLDGELAKLSAAAWPGSESAVQRSAGRSPSAAGSAPPVISAELVAALAGRTRSEDPWTVQAAILTGRPASALAMIRTVLDNAPRDAHVPATFSAVELARKLHAASRGLSQGLSPAQIGGTLKLWPPDRRDAILAAAARAPAASLAGLVERATATDAAQKSGLGDPRRNLELLALGIVSAIAGR